MLDRLKLFARNLSRGWKLTILICFDVVALSVVIWASYELRLAGMFRPDWPEALLLLLAPLFAVPVFLRLGLYRTVIRFLPERIILVIGQAMLFATIAWVAAVYLWSVYGLAMTPRSVPILYFLAGTIVIAGSRFAAKAFLAVPSAGVRRQVLIYGASDAGRQLVSALSLGGQRNVVGLIDEDRSLHGREIDGVRVYPVSAIAELIKNYGVGEVILPMTALLTAQRKQIYEAFRDHPVKIRTLPALTDLASGKYSVGALRQIDIDDLLGRSSVPADPGLLRKMIADRVILISGAGGSIGSELARLVARWNPKRIVLFEANEFALYEIARKLAAEAGVSVVPVLGSITDEALVGRVLAREAVQVVFHAAAHKHVSLLEGNVLEAVRNNVFGTATLAGAALEADVEHFVLISSDKAVRPTSVMGATKRWAELIIDNCAQRALQNGGRTRFCAVRFGNVLGSNGSVVPLFREQIAAGGPLTLTDRRMTRYFMSVHEAAELIVQAGAMSEGDDVFLLEMGAPIAIGDLAENMIRLAGLSVRSEGNPTGDIEITTLGARPGEKFEEELFYDAAYATVTAQPKILKARRLGLPGRRMETALAQLAEALDRHGEEEVRRLLFALVGDASIVRLDAAQRVAAVEGSQTAVNARSH